MVAMRQEDQASSSQRWSSLIRTECSNQTWRTASRRLGWLLCPAGLIQAIADLKIRADRGSPGLDQLVLAGVGCSELMLQDSPGFWEQLGYHDYGDPWRERRYQGD
jgi:DMSO/TMAO reductase YedYZ molybdopterin-dependent catalytic subunit